MSKEVSLKADFTACALSAPCLHVFFSSGVGEVANSSWFASAKFLILSFYSIRNVKAAHRVSVKWFVSSYPLAAHSGKFLSVVLFGHCFHDYAIAPRRWSLVVVFQRQVNDSLTLLEQWKAAWITFVSNRPTTITHLQCVFLLCYRGSNINQSKTNSVLTCIYSFDQQQWWIYGPFPLVE